jgi:hypothetical protein
LGVRLGVRIWDLGFVLALCVSASACGKKGPPLAPLVPLPAAVDAIRAERVGNDVFVTLTIPTKNVDEFTPADLARIEIYGYTGRTAPPRGRWVEIGALVGTVPVAPPPPQPNERPRPEPANIPADAPAQGAAITIRETLTDEELVQGKEPSPDPKSAIRDPQSAIRESPDRGSPLPAPLKRFYTAIPFNVKGRPGPPGTDAEFPITPVPDPPPSVNVNYGEKEITISWEPSGGLLGFLLERTIADEPSPVFEEEPLEPATVVAAPSGPVQYYVYRDISVDMFAPPSDVSQSPWRAEKPAPLNTMPTAAFSLTDGVEFGRRRCYAVRTVRGSGPDAVVGASSPEVCVTPIDTFPPAPPQSLAAVASEGAINLIWQPNSDLDLAGYIVLRGEAPGDTLQPLSATLVRDARYRDETVTSGMRYVYAVVAVDNRFPLSNVSTESERIEETAR